jgi:glycosyltransferase involved in cell wall biosynthesis
MLEISVVICSHNPRPPYLSRVLDALRKQTLSMDAWELLLIDNASKNLLADDWDISWHPKARHVLEEKLGLAHARQRGINESKAPIIVFVDDDNVLNSDYLENVVKIGHEWPILGVWGCGSSVPEFEVKPREDLTEYIHFLAAFEGKQLKWSNSITCMEATPCGVGLSVRSSVAKAYLESWNANSTQILDRNGTSLLSGGDYDIAYTACNIGLGMAVFPQLKVSHLIPKERVTEDYFVKLREGVATSFHLLNYKWRRVSPRNYHSILGAVSILGKMCLLRGVQRRMYLAEVRGAIAARRMFEATP